MGSPVSKIFLPGGQEEAEAPAEAATDSRAPTQA